MKAKFADSPNPSISNMKEDHEDHEDADIEDLEVCSIEGRKPRCVRRYRIRIDKDPHVVKVSHMTGLQLLELAGKCEPKRWRISQKLSNGKLEAIRPDQSIDFTAPGIERFITTPCDQTEGRGLRREFSLPARDSCFLEAEGFPWETVGSPGSGYLLIPRFLIPEGYNTAEAILALKIDSIYPDTQLDMVWFSPALQRRDGKSIRALTNETIDGKPFQRWSRHRTAQNPWRPEIDYVGTHLALVKDWLEREFIKNP